MSEHRERVEPAHQAEASLPRVRPPRYDFAAFEAKWRERWEREKLYQADLSHARHPYYNLMMFPYPSAGGLHVGNMYAYIGSDIHGRWMAMQGYDVFEPIGFDAFGIHSENFAIQRGIHPRVLTARNVERFREQQLKRIGNHSYGAGAVMGVPAHDERDMAFAKAVGLPVRVVVVPPDSAHPAEEPQEAFVQPGVLINSAGYSGMTSAQAAEALFTWFEACGKGQRVAKYRLRDWGPPIPIIYCQEHGAVPVPEEQLPVLLPDVENWMPTGTGVSPLAAIESFVHTTCPICGQAARRETDVSDNFLDSAWYFLRYLSHDDETQPWDPDLLRKWLPVDMYIGGAEHSVLHLMYVRFLTMALHDLGHLEFEEPFKRFRANGMITKDGAKISKSKGNIVNPDDYITRFGADVFRVYLVFMGPYQAGGDFSDRGIGGAVRFLDRVWSLVTRYAESASAKAPQGEERCVIHRLIKRVTEDLATLKYNTAVAALMGYLNSLEIRSTITQEELRTLVVLLAPMAPYITEELWQKLKHPGQNRDDLRTRAPGEHCHSLTWRKPGEKIQRSQLLYTRKTLLRDGGSI